jgi:endoglucanase
MTQPNGTPTGHTGGGGPTDQPATPKPVHRSLSNRHAAWVATAVAFLTLASSALGSALRASHEAVDHSSNLPPLEIRIAGNHFVDGGGRQIRLLGVNRAQQMHWISEDGRCATFDEMNNDPNLPGAIAAWHANVVRLTLNEDCWLGINGVTVDTGGTPYQDAIRRYVNRLHEAGLYVILDLQWSAPAEIQADAMQVMPDADHSSAFWASVAALFKGDRAVIFDLFNEPHPERGAPSLRDPWDCWLHGCMVGVVAERNGALEARSWRAAGMQELIAATRQTGATQPILLGGLDYANDASGWLSHLPTDPAHQLALSFHVYNWNSCRTERCWSTTLDRVAAHHPVVTGELGEDDCSKDFVDRYMSWADLRGISYLAWQWNVSGGTCEPGSRDVFLQDADSSRPSVMGVGFRDHLAALAVAPNATLSLGIR